MDIESNDDMLKVARLYLEKYESLTPGDKEIYRQTLRFFNTPIKCSSPERIDDAVAIADRMTTAIRGKTLTPEQAEVIITLVLRDLRSVTHG